MLGLGLGLTNFGTKGGVVDTPDLSGSSAAALLAAYGGEGFSMIFDSAAPSLKITDSTTPSNDWDSDLGDGYSVQDFFKTRSFTSYTGPVSSGKRLMQADGYIKPCRHNLLALSERLYVSSKYTATALAVAASSVSDPFGGTSSAVIITEDTSTGGHILGQSATVVAGLTYNGSIYVKAGTSDYVILAFGGASFTTSSFGVNLATGAATGGDTGSGADKTITSVGNGWYRISMSVVATASGSGTLNIYMSTDGTWANRSFTGTSRTIYSTGWQLNSGSSVLDYVSSEAHNICLQSQDVTTTWSNDKTTDAANSAVAPDGTTTADSVIDDATASARHIVLQTMTGMIAVPTTFSTYVKAGTRGFAYIAIQDASSKHYGVTVNLSTGAAGDTNSSGSPVNPSYTITSVGNGWYRVGVTVTPTAGTGYVIIGGADSATPASYSTLCPAYNGDGVSLFYTWGMQYELASSPGKYVATTSAAVYNQHFDIPVEYNSDGTVKALVREEARTNLLQRSGLFSNVIWTKSAACSITDNQVTSAFGIVDGTLVSFTGNGYIQQQVTSATGVHTAWSIVKAGTASYFRLSIFDSAHREAWFNLSAGTVGTTGSGVSATIESLGNGWYICTNTYTTTAANPYHASYFCQSDNTTPVNGDTGYCCHSQIEAAATRSSVIVTGSAAVTRAADVITWPTTIFPYNDTVGTWYAKHFAPSNIVAGARIISDNVQNRTMIQMRSTTYYGYYDGTTNTTNTDATLTLGTTNKVANAYSGSAGVMVANGGSSSSTAFDGAFNVTTIVLGMQNGGSGDSNCPFYEIMYVPPALSVASMQTLTTA